ncbi:hypothetical protein GCM10023080_079900 [Streptomyces pseudoechinosporeus]
MSFVGEFGCQLEAGEPPSTDRAGTLVRMTDAEWDDYRHRLAKRFA